jgi:hypothetical protein
MRELPAPRIPRGFGWLSAVGPGVIILGAAIGSGEFLLGPAAFVQYGPSLLWITTVAIVLQTLFNLEVMRYVMATGEPVFTGFMRTRPSAAGWAWFYAVLFFAQLGWPAWAAASASATFYLFAGRLPTPADANAVYLVGIATFLLCITILLLGRRIARTLEILNWILVAVILLSFLLLALWFTPATTWIAVAAGYVGYDVRSGGFAFVPKGMDFFLIGALVAYAGAGGVVNLSLGNWARDKGYGMAQHAGYIASAIGGTCTAYAHSGFRFTPDPDSMRRWRGWWRIASADQWGVFCLGAVLGMGLPALLYVALFPAGTDLRGPGIGAALAEALGTVGGPLLAVYVALLSVWLLFKSQLDILEGMVRSLTEILWSGSSRVRRFRGGDVRILYYAVLFVLVAWGAVALRLAPPIVLLQLSANVGAVVLVVGALHVLYVNTRLLPEALRPPLWRRAALLGMAVFYAVFAVLAARSLLAAM